MLELETLPASLRSAQLKYKLADLEVALNRTPITLRVTGYIQPAAHRAIGRDNLFRWFAAEWTPVDGNLGLHQPYRDWSQHDLAYRHVQVSGEAAVT